MKKGTKESINPKESFNLASVINNEKIEENWFSLFLKIFFILLIVALISFNWHNFPIQNNQFSLSLVDYDKLVTKDDVCFSLSTYSKNLGFNEETLLIKVNEKIVNSEVIEFNNKYVFCIENSYFDKNTNIVKSSILGRSVFFNVEKVEAYNLVDSEIKLNNFEKLNEREAKINFYIKNLENRREPVKIYRNEELIRNTFYEDGNNFEIIYLVSGENNFKIEFRGEEENFIINNNALINSNLLIGLIIITFSLFVLFTSVYSRKEILENIIYSISTFFIILMVLFFVLNYTGFLGDLVFLISFLIINIMILFLFKPYFKIPEFNLRKPNSFEIFLLLFLLATLLFNLFTPSNVSFWTSFYERQSETIYNLEQIPINDQLSEFGEKPFGYVSAYFFVNTGISFLIGDFSNTSFALIMFLANSLLFLSGINLFSKLNKNYLKGVLTVMLLILGGFILGDVFFNIRHVIAIALMFFSLSMLFDKNRFAFIPAAFAIWVQPPVIISIALISFILIDTPLIKKLKFWLYSLIVGLIIAVPTLLIHGIPIQAKPTVWGYLFGMPWYGVFVDLLAQLIFFFIIFLGLTKFNPKINDSSKKVLLFLGLLIIFQLFITYRVNTAVIIIFSYIGVKLLPTNLLNKFEIRHLLFVIFVGGSLFGALVLLGYTVPDYAVSSAENLELISSSEDRILNAPALGHYIAYFSNKKILNDLAVEYSDEQKIVDSYNFFLDKNLNILNKYNIDYVFSRDDFIETMPVGSPLLGEKLNFYSMDKIYDNGEFFIHLNRK